jgi:hypothetical protein
MLGLIYKSYGYWAVRASIAALEKHDHQDERIPVHCSFAEHYLKPSA